MAANTNSTTDISDENGSETNSAGEPQVVRCPNWTRREVDEMLHIWADESIQRIFSCGNTRNTVAYDRIAERLKGKGYRKRTGENIKTKLKNLKPKYYEAKRLMNTSGMSVDAARDLCTHFDVLDQVLADSPITEPTYHISSAAAAEDGVDPTELEVNAGDGAAQPHGEEPEAGKKKKQVSKRKSSSGANAEWMEKRLKQDEAMNKQFLEAQEREERMLQQRIADEKQFNNEMLGLLRGMAQSFAAAQQYAPPPQQPQNFHGFHQPMNQWNNQQPQWPGNYQQPEENNQQPQWNNQQQQWNSQQPQWNNQQLPEEEDQQ